MSKALICSMWLASLPPVCAQTVPEIMQRDLTQAQKNALLSKAYDINGKSMVGWGAIDLSDDPILCILHKGKENSYFECQSPPKVVQTEKIQAKEAFENRFLTPPPEKKKRHAP